MDYDLQHMYLGHGWSFGNSMIWGAASSGKSAISQMYFSKLRGVSQDQNKGKSPFKNA